MSIEIIRKYFHAIDEYKNEFRPPTTKEELIKLENLLAFVLPDDYKNFLLQSNGFEGFVNESFVRFIATEEVFRYTQDYCAEFFPWAVFIGTDEGNEMVVIDKRKTPNQFGLLPYIADEEDFISLGSTFESLIEKLYNNYAFSSD